MLKVADHYEIPKVGHLPPLNHIIREGVLRITPELADRILEEAPYPRNRKVEMPQVDTYAEMMRLGLWGLTDPITFASLNDRLLLINGRHRMLAVQKHGGAVDFRVAVNVVQTMKEVDSLYYRFDTVMRMRSVTDVLNSVDAADQHGVSKSMAKAVYASVGIIQNNYTFGNSSIADVASFRIVDLRLAACAPYWDAARIIDRAIRPAPATLKRQLLAAGRLAVGLTAARWQPEKAEYFYAGMAEDDGLKKTDPRKVFMRDLAYRRSMQLDQMIPVASAWNAFYEEREITHIKVTGNARLRIAGTPIGKGRSDA